MAEVGAIQLTESEIYALSTVVLELRDLFYKLRVWTR